MKLSKCINEYLNLRNLLIGTIIALTTTYIIFDRKLYSYREQTKSQKQYSLQVYEKLGTVYQRKGKRQPWLNLIDDDGVAAGTTMQSQQDGHVILYFQNNKGRLEISADTQVSIHKQENSVVIDLLYGEIFINYSSDKESDRIYVRYNNKLFSILNTDIHLRTDSVVSRERLRVSVDYGSVEVDIDGKPKHFESGQIVQFTGSKNYTVLEPNIRMITPLNFERYSLSHDGNRKIRFAWEPLLGMDRVQLLWGITPNDLKPYFRNDQSWQENQFFINLPQGVYYWRLLGYSELGMDEKYYSKIHKIFVKEQVPIEPLSPQRGVTLLRRGHPIPIQFQWRNSSNFEKLFVEISLKRDFSDLLYHESVQNTDYYILPVDETGKIYWRVNGFPHGSSKLINGRINSFFIKDSKALAAPKLVFPLSSVQISRLDLLENFLRFKWLGIKGKYKVILESDPDESGKGFYWESSLDNPLIPFLQPGMYFWKVINLENQTESGFQKFYVLRTGKLNWIEYNKGRLDWDPGPESTRQYMLKIMNISSSIDLSLFYETRKSDKAEVLFSKTDSYLLDNLPNGKYAIKVYSLDAKQKIIADSSIFYFSHE